ncbi:hypothetical protein QC764_121700 [Podospora pseudoanserina]|uniref:Tyrosinase copper-binding domain-containing protein n=1 Tax=Podospora pseudoanserina TaxID=2609844 RepID=A0ABR0ISC5_9PEZI|nr:hypothetical protein QC764_121700 [Podospora pseudoanserina]
MVGGIKSLMICASAALAACTPTPPTPIVRKEWRTLTTSEKAEYINAVKCILAKPALTPESSPPTGHGVISRYDNLVYTHIQQTMQVHYVGHFLAWHRLFTATYEKMLRNECGYTGAQPYWDWTLDAADITASPVFDPVTGFGGNGPWVPSDPTSWMPPVPGRTGGGCVVDGPFAGINDLVHLGPESSLVYNPQCLKRDLAPSFASMYLGMNQTQLTLSQPDFGWFNAVVEGSPSFDASGVHGGGHFGVGGTFGQMGDLYTSPADPIFHLHHANLDRLWWSWQSLNLPARLSDISGPSIIMDPTSPNVTLAHPLSVGVSGVDTTVGDVMKIDACGTGGSMCYTYDSLYTLL